MTGALRKNVHAERTRTEPIAEGWLPMTAHTLFEKFTLRAALALLACLLIGPGPLAHAQAEPDDASPAARHTVLITGANRGIGRALAEGLIDHGVASVYAAVRNKASAAETINCRCAMTYVVEDDTVQSGVLQSDIAARLQGWLNDSR